MKKFLVKLSYTVFPLWLILVSLVSYISYIDAMTSGDIGKLGIILFESEYNQMLEKNTIKDTLFQTVYKTEDLKSINVDVLTIGDSFSQQKNVGYQNYLCQQGLTVINCYRFLYSSPLQFAYNLLAQNIIDSTNVRVLVVENVERDLKGNFCNFDINQFEKGKNHKSQGHNNASANEWSVSRARDFILYKTGRKNCPIYTANLDKDLFSTNEPRKLYFYFQDILNGVCIDKEDEKTIKQVFNTILLKAKEKGIVLYLMVAVDKYDLYQKHIVNNDYPEKTINEDVERIIGDTPYLLLTKQYLLPLVEQGEKDVFKNNDTHWSYKASKAVADELYKRIKNH